MLQHAQQIANMYAFSSIIQSYISVLRLTEFHATAGIFYHHIKHISRIVLTASLSLRLFAVVVLPCYNRGFSTVRKGRCWLHICISESAAGVFKGSRSEGQMELLQEQSLLFIHLSINLFI